MDYLFPLNPSLSDELQRLFARMPSRLEPQILENTDDFHSNGVERDLSNELEWVSNWSQALSPATGHMMPQPRVNYLPASMRRPYITMASNAAMRGKRRGGHTECVFCRNNGEPSTWYKSHSLRDSAGRVTCPVLRAYTCPICGTSGDNAHTIKYCPRNRNTADFPINSMGLAAENNPFMRRNRAK